MKTCANPAQLALEKKNREAWRTMKRSKITDACFHALPRARITCRAKD